MHYVNVFPGICAHDLQVYSDRCQQTPLIAKIHSCNSGCKRHTHTHAHAHAHAHALTQEHARTQKNTHTYTHICKYGFITNMYYSKYCLRMLQPSFRAVLIRAAMGVLALRREKDNQCSCSSNYEGKTCNSGYYYVLSVYKLYYHITV